MASNTIFRSRLVPVALVIIFAVVAHSCKTSSKTTASNKKPDQVITYNNDIKPIMINSCNPCHFPEHGQKRMLDTYIATKNDADDIIRRIQLHPSNEEFMPFKSKKPALTESEIAVFKQWRKQGLKE